MAAIAVAGAGYCIRQTLTTITKEAVKKWGKRILIMTTVRTIVETHLIRTWQKEREKGDIKKIDLTKKQRDQLVTDWFEKYKEEIEEYARDAAEDWVDEHLAFSYWDLFPGVGEYRLYKQIRKVCFSNEVEEVIEKAVLRKIRYISEHESPPS